MTRKIHAGHIIAILILGSYIFDTPYRHDISEIFYNRSLIINCVDSSRLAECNVSGNGKLKIKLEKFDSMEYSIREERYPDIFIKVPHICSFPPNLKGTVRYFIRSIGKNKTSIVVTLKDNKACVLAKALYNGKIYP